MCAEPPYAKLRSLLYPYLAINISRGILNRSGRNRNLSATSFFAAPQANNSAIWVSRCVSPASALISISPNVCSNAVLPKYQFDGDGLACLGFDTSELVSRESVAVVNPQRLPKLLSGGLYVNLSKLHKAGVKSFFVNCRFAHFSILLSMYSIACLWEAKLFPSNSKVSE